MMHGCSQDDDGGGSEPNRIPLVDPRRRAVADLLARRVLDRRAADGQRLGLQSQVSLESDGTIALDLASIADGLTVDEDPKVTFAADPNRDDLLEMVRGVERRLGFPIEPEFFSNMIFVAYLGHLADPELRSLAQGLLETYRRRSMFGLYGFFASMRFACDIDCTGVAMWSQLALGTLDPRRDSDAGTLAATTARILKSAAVQDVAAAANESKGRSNGALHRDVFKVYLDDHEIQGALLDRGLKQDAVTVCHALQPVLAEIAAGRRTLDEPIELLEFDSPHGSPRRRQSDVGSIVRANLAYVAEHLQSRWRDGTRYYPLPEAVLCAASELCSAFPGLLGAHGVRSAVETALLEQRTVQAPNVLALALRAITADNLEIDATPDLEALLSCEGEGFGRFAPYYRMPSAKRVVYFGSPDQTLAFVIRALSPRSAYPRAPALVHPAGARALDSLAR